MNRPNVLVLDDKEGLIARSSGAERMRESADVRILDASLDSLSEAELAEVQVLMPIRERTKLDAVALSRLPKLELVLQTGGHAYHLDADYAKSHGIPVALGRRAFGPRAAIPELTFALAVAALRMMPQANASMANGEWKPFMGRTLSGRTLGILGYGRHGKNVARIAEAYNMKVLVWQRTPEEAGDAEVERVGMDELLQRSDVLSIHLKLTDESRGLIGADELAKMKPGSILVNTARGAIIDEDALVEVLRDGSLSAAALDVFAHEPLAPDSPLRTLPNVVLTPHVGWTVEEVLTEFADIASGQLEQYLDGQLSRGELLDAEVQPRDGALGGLTDPGA